MPIPLRLAPLAGALLLLPGCQLFGSPRHEGWEVSTRPFGTTREGVPVEEYELRAPDGVVVDLITRGAAIRELHVPDRTGESADVVLGFDDVVGYESERNQYFGAIVGRVANRIAKGRFTLDGKTYTLATNNGPNSLHGGNRGFDAQVWQAEEVPVSEGVAVRFRLTSPDGDEGYPGTVHAEVTYTLLPGERLRMEYRAETDQRTPVNLTNHAYFNLAGAGAPTVLDHVLTLFASHYTPTDDTLIPTGEIAPVAGTPLDFREPEAIGHRIHTLDDTGAMGYDHNFVLDRDGDGLMRAARVEHEPSGRWLEVWTTEPGLQFYSGNFLFGQEGKDGETYAHRSALCLEAQHYPDSVNHPNFPSIVLSPGETYHQVTEYRFGAR